MSIFCEVFVGIIWIIVTLILFWVWIVVVIILFLLSLICNILLCFKKNEYIPSLFLTFFYIIVNPYIFWWPYVNLPFIHCKYGKRILYLGKLQRNSKELDEITGIPMDVVEFENEYSMNNLANNYIRIVCLSDTHNAHHWYTNNIPNGHILIHCGDITFQGFNARNVLYKFIQWFGGYPHTYKIFIGGNHDKILNQMNKHELKTLLNEENITYLCNNGIHIPEYNGLNIFGCPWSPANKYSINNAFQNDNDVNKLKSFMDEYKDMDILLGHSDLTLKENNDEYVKYLKELDVNIHICGHHHLWYGTNIKEKWFNNASDMLLINCSVLDGIYRPKQFPIVFDLCTDK